MDSEYVWGVVCGDCGTRIFRADVPVTDGFQGASFPPAFPSAHVRGPGTPVLPAPPRGDNLGRPTGAASTLVPCRLYPIAPRHVAMKVHAAALLACLATLCVPAAL